MTEDSDHSLGSVDKSKTRDYLLIFWVIQNNQCRNNAWYPAAYPQYKNDNDGATAFVDNGQRWAKDRKQDSPDTHDDLILMIDVTIGRTNIQFVTSTIDAVNIFHFQIKYSRFVS